MSELDRQQWAAMMETVVAAHPEWVATTMAAVQRGIVEAIEHQKDRSHLLGMGLTEALKDRRSKSRDSARIVAAVRASHFHPTIWSAKIIAKEEQDGPSDHNGVVE